MKYTFEQIRTFAQNAGFQGDDADRAAAIAMAESGGDPDAYNPEIAAGTPEGEGSVGLWQIYRKAHPQFEKVNLLDPQLNANAAWVVFVTAHPPKNFMPWSTFKTGAYLKFMPAPSAIDEADA